MTSCGGLVLLFNEPMLLLCRLTGQIGNKMNLPVLFCCRYIGQIIERGRRYQLVTRCVMSARIRNQLDTTQVRGGDVARVVQYKALGRMTDDHPWGAQSQTTGIPCGFHYNRLSRP
uniref:Uncharacterized protein n=1 Tax=Cacopsylla melanoneura TaxID=428564 RepID=A0A8D8Z020_9HEMI